jgi:ethanolamine transporter EutH
MANGIQDFLKTVAADPAVPAPLKLQAQTLSNFALPPAIQNDVWLYRIVIVVLGVTVLATILGGLGLAYKGDVNYKLPAEIVAIGSAAVGALAGLLAPSPVK